MLEYEADEHVIERVGREGKRVEVGDVEAHVAKPGAADALAGERHGGRRDIDGHQLALRTPRGQHDGLRTDAAAGFQDALAGGVRGPIVQQVGEGCRLILQPTGLRAGVAVDVAVRHRVVIPVRGAVGKQVASTTIASYTRAAMKRLIPLSALAILSLSACASGSFLGLATSAYVDEQLAATKGEVESARQELRSQLQTELSTVRVDVDRVDELTRELEQLLATIRENERATQELQQLATVVASRLEELPTETLRRLVEILQSHLEATP